MQSSAFVERGILSIQLECMDHFIALGEAHMNYLVAQFIEHYHAERPHQGISNKLIRPTDPAEDGIPSVRQIVWHERLGGLLKHFERRAA